MSDSPLLSWGDRGEDRRLLLQQPDNHFVGTVPYGVDTCIQLAVVSADQDNVLYDSVEIDVPASHVQSYPARSLQLFHEFSLGIIVVYGDRCVIKISSRRKLFLGSYVCNIVRKPWFSTTEYGRKSLTIKVAMEFDIRFASSELGGVFFFLWVETCNMVSHFCCVSKIF